VFDWSGNNPIFPEVWIAPQFLPFHPSIYSFYEIFSFQLPVHYILDTRGSVEISLLYLPMFMSFSGKFWCLTRMVYLPMAYLYGKKFIGPITPTVLALREEIHDSPYGKIDWSNARNKCAKVCHIPCGSTVHYHHICPSILWDCI
jgi:hypothetical protein